MHFFDVFDADHFSCVFIAMISIEDPQNIVYFRVEAPYKQSSTKWTYMQDNIVLRSQPQGIYIEDEGIRKMRERIQTINVLQKG